MRWELNDLNNCYFIILACNDVTNRAAIFKWRKISKRKQAFVTLKYLGQFCAKFQRNRFRSFCVIEPQTPTHFHNSYCYYMEYPKVSRLVRFPPTPPPTNTLFTPLTAGLSSAPSLLATQHTFIRERAFIHATELRNEALDGRYFCYVFSMFDDPVSTFRHTISVLLSESFDFTDPSYHLYAELVECGQFLNLK